MCQPFFFLKVGSYWEAEEDANYSSSKNAVSSSTFRQKSMVIFLGSAPLAETIFSTHPRIPLASPLPSCQFKSKQTEKLFQELAIQTSGGFAGFGNGLKPMKRSLSNPLKPQPRPLLANIGEENHDESWCRRSWQSRCRSNFLCRESLQVRTL